MSIVSFKNLSIQNNLAAAASPNYAELWAAGFARTATDFGTEVNPRFPDRICAIAFINGVLFRSWHADEVPRLIDKLESSPSLPFLDLSQAAAQLAAALPKGPGDLATLQSKVAPLVYSGIKSPQSDAELPGPLGRAILLGLNLATLRPELAERIVTWLKRMPHEPAFLVSRLSAWSAFDDLPYAEAIVEFAFSFYKNRPHEREFVCGGLHDAWLIARHRPDPWELSAWVYHAFARGQRLFILDPKEARLLISEVPRDEMERTLKIYRDTAVAGTSGERFDVLQATLRYFASAREGVLGRYYCEHAYPRLLVVRAYDYAVWTGLFAKIPIDVSRLDAETKKEAAK
jgi:hypothetical protein